MSVIYHDALWVQAITAPSNFSLDDYLDELILHTADVHLYRYNDRVGVVQRLDGERAYTFSESLNDVVWTLWNYIEGTI